MASTVGLSDEAVEAMIAAQHESLSSSSGGCGPQQQQKQRRSKMLQNRLEMPMGTKPAATVLRRAPPPADNKTKRQPSTTTTTTKQPTKIKIPQQQEHKITAQTQAAPKQQQQQQGETKRDTQPVVLGSIMERPRRPRKSRTNNNIKNKQEESKDPIITGVAATSGFPSLQVPLGTFVAQQKQSPDVAESPPMKPVNANNTSDSSKNLEKLHQETSQEADSLLAQMSSAEIDESKRELEHTLSPELLQFLRQRHKQKKKELPSLDQSKNGSDSKTDPGEAAAPVSTTGMTEPRMEMASESVPSNSSTKRNSQVVEEQPLPGDDDDKNRDLYRRLASIQTYEDMDAAYKAEHGETSPFHVAEPQSSDSTLPRNEQEERFSVACDLLRSSVPRQNLWAVQTIRTAFWNDLTTTTTPNRKPTEELPYPLTLPVSLRCLLDAPASHRSSNGYVLHAHVLQSIYFLLRMLVAPEHDVDVLDGMNDTGSEDSPSTYHSLYQKYYANDAVPSRPIDQQYGESTKLKPLTVQGHEKVAYSSESSSDSATKDGKSFWKDPLWTLLSQMRIIPKLAQLVQKSVLSANNSESLLRLPNEGISAACGILAMIAQRSPGAASAIAQHETLTSNLLALAVNDASGEMDPMVALPVIIFFSVLARQTSVAAKSLEDPHTEELLTRVLSMQATGSNKATFAMQQWTLILWRTLLRYGYGINLLEAVLTVTASKRALGDHQWQFNPELFSCLTIMLRSPQVMEIRWMIASVVKSAIVCLEEQSQTESARNLNPRQVLTVGTCLDFLKACQDLDEITNKRTGSNNQAHEDEGFFTEDEKFRIGKSLTALSANGFVQRTIKIALGSFFLPSPTLKSCASFHETRSEASMSLFVATFFALLLVAQRRTWIPAEDAAVVLQSLGRHMESEALCSFSSQNGGDNDMRSIAGARRAWRNRCHTHIASVILGQSASLSADPTISGAMVIALLGRFEAGDEALALEMLQLGLTLLPQCFPMANNLSVILAMLRRNLTSTTERSAQLAHAIHIEESRIQEQDSTENSELPSLCNVLSGPSIKSSEMLLPVGKYWLWKVLAGSAETSPSRESQVVSGELLQALEAGCLVILDLEKSAIQGVCLYVNFLNVGGKLYYLMNLCLQDETILGYDEIMVRADYLISWYSSSLDRFAVTTFLAECSSHSSGYTEDTDDNNLTADEEKVKAWLEKTDDPKSMKSVTTFIGDLCTAYIEYGAQYGSFFARCIRTLLLPAFPTKIRCEVLRRLEGLLHLLTIENEDAALRDALAVYLEIPGQTGEPNDDSEWLDALARLFAKGSGGQRSDFKFMRCLAICSLGRTMANSIRGQTTASNLDIAKTRLEGTDDEFALACARMALHLVENSCDASAKVEFGLTLLESPGGMETSKHNKSVWDKISEAMRRQGRAN